MEKAEYLGNEGCPQRDRAEHEEYAGVRSIGRRETGETDGADLLESSRRYLEGKLKLRMNMDKSRVVSVYAIRKFKFLGFALGKGKNGAFIRAHAKSLQKAKQKLKELTSRSHGGNVRKVIYNVKVFIRGWLGYFGMACCRGRLFPQILLEKRTSRKR